MRRETSLQVGRRSFIVGAAALTVAACGGDDDEGGRGRDRTTTSRPRESTAPSPAGQPGGLQLRGINYDTDRGERAWRSDYVQREIAAIRNDLHCNSILLLGHELDRLTESANIAADQGLQVWFEPRQFDASAEETTDYVASVARAAEELRADLPDVGLSLGCELTIFMDGLVPGSDWSERGEALGTPESAGYDERLNRYLADSLETVRPLFGGQITYTSGEWEQVDWRDFDVVGVDLYRDETNAATYVQQVRDLHRHGKPVVITEFGCGSYQGAQDAGGAGFMIVDWWSGPEPVVTGNPVRDEQVQATYIGELLDVFEAEGVHGAFIYDFIEPDSPHSPDTRYDFDLAGYAVVKCHPTGSDLAYDTSGHWEPKLAFHTIAERFG